MKKIFFVNFDPDLHRILVKGLAGRTRGEKLFLISAIGETANKSILKHYRNIDLVIVVLEPGDINKNIFVVMSARQAFKGPMVIVSDNAGDIRNALGAMGGCPDVYDSTREDLPDLAADILFPANKL